MTNPTTVVERQVSVHSTSDPKSPEIVYTLRGLSEEEVLSWADFCATVFAYKDHAPPATYFARHYYNDPERNASFIRVAIFESTVVASCRIFCRQVSGGVSYSGRPIRAGGIGEVCTAESHRNRGLSKELLRDAISIMESEGMEISFLHAAPTFFPFYRKAGYVETVSLWSIAKIHRGRLQLPAFSDQTTIRQASFPGDTKQLMALHHKYSENNFAGCIVRSSLYWSNYLSNELEGTLWVATQANGSVETVLGWLSVSSKGEMFQLREFGCNPDLATVDNVLPVLLGHATKQETLLPPTQTIFPLKLPTFIVDQLSRQKQTADFLLWEDDVVEANDRGWMYRSLRSERCVAMSDITKECQHLIWPADSF
ncbi:hypothetical protein ACA910_000783 [Epithemia clementina (nom. ined.)]